MVHARKVRPQLAPLSPEENAEITAAALADPDAQPLTDEQLAQMRPVWEFPELVAVLQHHGKLGRPPLAAADKKHRVTLYLDPDIIARLKADGKGWQTRASAELRRALGL